MATYLVVLLFFIFSCERNNTTKYYFRTSEIEQDSLESLVEIKGKHLNYNYVSDEKDNTTCLVREEWYEELYLAK